jgi:sortase (surface protein transpeptidase)
MGSPETNITSNKTKQNKTTKPNKTKTKNKTKQNQTKQQNKQPNNNQKTQTTSLFQKLRIPKIQDTICKTHETQEELRPKCGHSAPS